MTLFTCFKWQTQNMFEWNGNFSPNWIWTHSTRCAFDWSKFFRSIDFEFSTHSHTFYAKTMSIQFVTLSLLSIDDIDVDLFLFHSSRRIYSSEMPKGSIFVFVFGDTLSLIDKSCWCHSWMAPRRIAMM